jgi:hypothetical protein
MTDLEMRVAVLEESRTRMRMVLATLFVVFATVAMVGQSAATGERVTAREILIIDGNGRVTAKITSGHVFGEMAGIEINDPKDQHMLTVTRLGEYKVLVVSILSTGASNASRRTRLESPASENKQRGGYEGNRLHDWRVGRAHLRTLAPGAV